MNNLMNLHRCINRFDCEFKTDNLNVNCQCKFIVKIKLNSFYCLQNMKKFKCNLI